MSSTKFALLALLSIGCSESTSAPTEDARRALLAAWGEQIIMPGYGAVVRDATALGAALETLCEAPDAARVDAAQAAWRAGKSALAQMNVFAFGPAIEQPVRALPKLNFWPARPEAVGELLAGDAPITEAALTNAATRGYPGIEAVLWAGAPPDARACDYLRAAAADLVTQAQALATEWDPAAGDFLGVLTEPRDPYPTLNDALSQVVGRMGYAIEDIRAERVGEALGEDGAPAQPAQLESSLSDRSVDEIRDTLKGVERLYRGAAPGFGVSDKLGDRRADIDAAFDAALAGARAALDAIEGPLREAVVARPEQVRAALDALGEVQRVLQVDVVAALGLSLRFNDSDGD